MNRSNLAGFLVILAAVFGSCSHSVTPPPPDAVTVSGPKSGVTLAPYTFTASINFTSQAALVYRWIFADTTISRNAIDSITRSFPLKDTGRQIFSLHVIRTGDSTVLCSTTDTIFISDTSHAPPNPNDTSSHNFTWTEFTNVNGENNMTGCWVFGPKDIYANNDGLYHFDGSTWTRVTLNGQTPGGLSGFSMFGFSPSDYWLYGYDILYHWNGTSLIETRLENTGVWHDPPDGAIHGAWGTSSNDMYFVGDSGTILHFDGTNWTKMNSGTTKMLTNIWGTSSNDIWAVGYNSSTGDGEVVHYDGSSWKADVLATAGTAHAYGVDDIYTCDSAGHKFVSATGSEVFRRTDNGPWYMDSTVPNGDHIGIGITGNSANDLLVAGGWGVVAHWNGKSWLRYDQFYDLSNPAYGAGALSMKGNTACVVGIKNGTSWVIIGQR